MIAKIIVELNDMEQTFQEFSSLAEFVASDVYKEASALVEPVVASETVPVIDAEVAATPEVAVPAEEPVNSQA